MWSEFNEAQKLIPLFYLSLILFLPKELKSFSCIQKKDNFHSFVYFNMKNRISVCLICRLRSIWRKIDQRDGTYTHKKWSESGIYINEICVPTRKKSMSMMQEKRVSFTTSHHTHVLLAIPCHTRWWWWWCIIPWITF